MNCAKCGVELKKVLLRHQVASKTYMKKAGYDGAEFVELYDKMLKYGFENLPEPYTVKHRFYEGGEAQFVKFALCIKCSKDADWGEDEE